MSEQMEILTLQNVRILQDSVGVTRNQLSATKQLIGVNKNLTSLLEGLGKGFNVLANEFRRLGSIFTDSTIDLISAMTTGKLYRTFAEWETPLDFEFGVEEIDIAKRLKGLDWSTLTSGESIVDQIKDGIIGVFTPFKEMDLFNLPSIDDSSGGKGSGGKGKSEGLFSSEDFANPITGMFSIAKKVGGKEMFKQMGNTFKELGPQMANMALVTQPMQAMLQGMLEPFMMLTDIFGMFGAILGEAFMPLIVVLSEQLMSFTPIIQMLGGFIGALIPIFSRLVTKLFPLLANILMVLSPVLDALVPLVDAIVTPIADLLTYFLSMEAVMDGIIWVVERFVDVIEIMQSAIEWITDKAEWFGSEERWWN